MIKALILGLPGGAEIIIIFFVILLLFGGRKIPELMRGIGKGIREFNSARATIETEIKEGMKEDEKNKKQIEGRMSEEGQKARQYEEKRESKES
jgi:sec-independent protein translocase protein TatA